MTGRRRAGSWPAWGLLRAAALLAPRAQRAEWLAEWTGELCFILEGTSTSRQAAAFCLGAFRDTLWLRRNGGGPCPARRHRLESPVQCVLALTVLAAASVMFAFGTPEIRALLVPSPYRDAQRLMLISHQKLGKPAGTVPADEYHWLESRGKYLFAGLAFYQTAKMRVDTADLSIASASSNLLSCLGLPLRNARRRRPWF